MKNIKNVRKAVATMANRINKKLNDLSAAFKKAWAIIKGRIQSKVSGVTYGQSQKALYRLAKYNLEAVSVELIREVNNQHDGNAVSVNVSVNASRSYKLGYLPQDLAKYISRLIDNGVKLITEFKSVTGGTADKYYYGALIEIQF